jgi:YfiH family protein
MDLKAPPRAELYHWGGGRISVGEEFAKLWREGELAGDHVLTDSGETARMIFGLGPAYAVRSPEDRMARVLETLTPDVLAIRWGEQVHGRFVRTPTLWEGPGHRRVGCVGDCDALITSEAGLGLLVWTADCVPILMNGGSVVAAVHSGWRGAAADIAGAVVHQFGSDYGIRPSQIRAALGPAISGPRFPVGSEVVEALRPLGVEESRWLNGHHVDLRGFLEARLEACGLAPESVTTVGRCTASSADLASYRRDGDASGRQWSLIYRPAVC